MKENVEPEELLTIRLPEGKIGGAQVTIYEPVLTPEGKICLPVCMGEPGKAPTLLQDLDIDNLREILSGYDFPETIEESSDSEDSEEEV